jgi:tRNA(Ile)-lysidine synthase
LYHVGVHLLVQRVLSHLRRQELLRAGDRVGVAVSGGIDSVALLRVLLELRGELGIVLSVVHFNHMLRGADSDADQKFVADLAREHDLELHVDRADVAEHAAEEHVSLETAARELRYGFFRSLLGSGEKSPSGAEAPGLQEDADRSAGSAAPPQDGDQGLKPALQVPQLRGPEGPLFHGSDRTVGSDRAVGSGKCTALNKIVTGHTLDDQAETVLMRLIRGAGLKGLGGIYPRIAVEDDEEEICGEIVRPLLATRRHELERYLNDIGQSWREDATNLDEKFTRNRVRRLVVPLLEREFNPAVAENLAELAEIAREEEDYWENEIAGWIGTIVHWSEPEWARKASAERSLVQISSHGKAPTPPKAADSDLEARIADAPWLVANASVSRVWLLGEPAAVQRRLVKAIGERAGMPLEFKHVDEVLRFAAEDGVSGKKLSLPLGWTMVREPEELVFLTPDLREAVQPQDYEYELLVPGQTIVPEAGVAFEAQRIPAEAASGYNPEQLLDAESLPGLLKVRNWRPGDRFWPPHTKLPKKIKELLQERHVAQPERKLWPVVLNRDEIVWVRGFPVPAKLRAQPGHDAILIVEKPLADGSAT